MNRREKFKFIPLYNPTLLKKYYDIVAAITLSEDHNRHLQGTMYKEEVSLLLGGGSL